MTKEEIDTLLGELNWEVWMDQGLCPLCFAYEDRPHELRDIIEDQLRQCRMTLDMHERRIIHRERDRFAKAISRLPLSVQDDVLQALGAQG